MIDPSPKLYGLLGHPVKHSFSPKMHNAVFKELAIKGEYRLFDTKEEDVGLFLKSLDRENICGLNVTIPYKGKVLDFIDLDKESFYLNHIKAVNTVVKKDGILKGFNTDIPGFEKHLSENFKAEGKKTALLGAGGASRAVSYVLAKLKVKELVIFDIDIAKSQSIVDMIKGLFAGANISFVTSIDKLNIRDKDLLVNATPVGMKDEDSCLVTEDMLHKDLFVYDLIYNPYQTKLLTLAKKLGLQFSNGLGMLLYQGALSFIHFTDTSVYCDKIIGIMGKALNEELGI